MCIGTDPLRYYELDRRVSSVMIEIRRDVYLDEPSTPRPRAITALSCRLAQLLESAAAT